jgi:ribosome-associated protein
MNFTQEGPELSAPQFSSAIAAGLIASEPKDPETLLAAVLGSLDDAKAEDIVAIDIRGKTPIADHMVVCSGRSQRHVGAIAEHLLQDLKDGGFGTAAVEGQPACDWVLVDTGDVIVHVFRPEVRQFYNIEKMWAADNPVVAARRG